jgi:hypothetical protein
VVLLNVARHDEFASVVADSSEAADTLVDLMQMFRDKKNIFGRASELLCRLISASAKIKVSSEIIMSVCLLEDFSERELFAIL